MKASELITLLQDAIDKYGDLEVETVDPYMADVILGWRLLPMNELNFPDVTEPSFFGIEPVYE